MGIYKRSDFTVTSNVVMIDKNLFNISNFIYRLSLR